MDSINAIKATLYDRLHSPFLGSFSIAWSIINYKTLLIIFSSLSVREKIKYIEDIPSDEKFIFYFTYPLLVSFFYMFIFPYAERFMYGVWRDHQNKLKDIKIKKDEVKALDEDEARDLKRHHLDLMKGYDESYAVLRSDNENAKTELEEQNSIIKKMKMDLEAKNQEVYKKDEDIEALNKFILSLKDENKKLSGLIEIQSPIVEKYHEVQVMSDGDQKMDFSPENVKDIRNSFEKSFQYLLGIISENSGYSSTIIEFNYKNGSIYESLAFLYMAKEMGLTKIHKNGKMSLTKFGCDILKTDMGRSDMFDAQDKYLIYLKKEGTEGLMND
ncbi:hypothetical protein H9C73_13980 [Marinobacterium sp. AK62]|uniref:Uncharacterized protein n=2 Tax=Marinobacterium alkalitolerans TaxID=1542925 RepID=A0ABS3ZDQ4_9GAMM|nr:hypothetical protein [Marinobacterium alkalitolerans]